MMLLKNETNVDIDMIRKFVSRSMIRCNRMEMESLRRFVMPKVSLIIRI